MQEYDVFPTYASAFIRLSLPFTRVPLALTGGSKELRFVVCRHCLFHVDNTIFIHTCMYRNVVLCAPKPHYWVLFGLVLGNPLTPFWSWGVTKKRFHKRLGQ